MITVEAFEDSSARTGRLQVEATRITLEASSGDRPKLLEAVASWDALIGQGEETLAAGTEAMRAPLCTAYVLRAGALSSLMKSEPALSSIDRALELLAERIFQSKHAWVHIAHAWIRRWQILSDVSEPGLVLRAKAELQHYLEWCTETQADFVSQFAEAYFGRVEGVGRGTPTRDGPRPDLLTALPAFDGMLEVLMEMGARDPALLPLVVAGLFRKGEVAADAGDPTAAAHAFFGCAEVAAPLASKRLDMAIRTAWARAKLAAAIVQLGDPTAADHAKHGLWMIGKIAAANPKSEDFAEQEASMRAMLAEHGLASPSIEGTDKAAVVGGSGAEGEIVLTRGSAPLSGDRVTVGRDATRVHVVIEHNTIARYHATVDYGAGTVIDHSSGGGTFLGDTKIPRDVPVPLDSSGFVRFGMIRVATRHLWSLMQPTPAARAEEHSGVAWLVIAPRASTSADVLVKIGDVVHRWQQAHPELLSVAGLAELRAGRSPKTPSRHLPVPVASGDENAHEHVGLVFIQADANQQALHDALVAALGPLRQELEWLTSTAEWAYYQR